VHMLVCGKEQGLLSKPAHLKSLDTKLDTRDLNLPTNMRTGGGW